MTEAGETAPYARGTGEAMLSAAFVHAEALSMLNAVQAQQQGAIARQAVTVTSCARLLASGGGDPMAFAEPGVAGLSARNEAADHEPQPVAKPEALITDREAPAAADARSAPALQLAATIAVQDAVDYLRSATSFAIALRAAAAVCEAAEKGSGAAQWAQADAVVESALAHLQNVSKLAESLVRAVR